MLITLKKNKTTTLLEMFDVWILTLPVLSFFVSLMLDLFALVASPQSMIGTHKIQKLV